MPDDIREQLKQDMVKFAAAHFTEHYCLMYKGVGTWHQCGSSVYTNVKESYDARISYHSHPTIIVGFDVISLEPFTHTD